MFLTSIYLVCCTLVIVLHCYIWNVPHPDQSGSIPDPVPHYPLGIWRNMEYPESLREARCEYSAVYHYRVGYQYRLEVAVETVGRLLLVFISLFEILCGIPQ